MGYVKIFVFLQRNISKYLETNTMERKVFSRVPKYTHTYFAGQNLDKSQTR